MEILEYAKVYMLVKRKTPRVEICDSKWFSLKIWLPVFMVASAILTAVTI